MNLSSSSSVSGSAENFDPKAGSMLERLVFGNRILVLLLVAVVTAFFGVQASKLKLAASFEKMIPQNHQYIQNYNFHKNELAGLGNAVRIALENPEGSIYEADYMETLRQLSDEVFVLPGVDRLQMRSLWTPSVRWVGVTEDGLEGGPVIPEHYDGSSAKLQELADNIARSGEIGQIVGLDGSSSVIFVPLLGKDRDGRPLDYAVLAEQLESLREKYEAEGYRMHITGFAKIVGDLIEGVRSVLTFFILTVVIGGIIVFWFTRCWLSTIAVVFTSLVAVLWQLGMLPTLGYALDPYSILVPFLVFAIGMSHGLQQMNGVLRSVGRGRGKIVAARITFRRLFRTGMTALLTDSAGFAVLLVIQIQAIRELSIAASMGVVMLIFTNLIMLPVLLSYIGVCPNAAKRSLRSEIADAHGEAKHPLWRFLDLFTHRRWATIAILAGLGLGIGGGVISTQIKIGDLDPGAPELRPNSRYNRDVAFFTQSYGASSDVMAVMVETPQGYCSQYETLLKVDALEWELRQLEGVETTNSLSLLNRQMMAGYNEGNFQWYDFVPNQAMLNAVTARAPRGLYDEACSLLTVYIFLSDHKAETLNRVVDHVEAFAKANNTEDVKFLLAAGSAGIEAATNIVVADAWGKMMLLVYGVVIFLTFLNFKKWRPVVVAVLPLMLTSVLAEALMVKLGMGVKVATLPVIAVGVGIGVDYALYILSTMLTQMKEGKVFCDAFYHALLASGKVVMLTGITLAIGVSTWIASPIKFQADMGLLLAFMFIWNMIGAMILLPALARFLLRLFAERPETCSVPSEQKNTEPKEWAASPDGASSHS